jgi:hypothetical protein
VKWAAALACVAAAVHVASADPDPKRKVVVLEYRSGSSALTGIANRVVTAIGKETSLQVLGPDQTRAIYGDHLEQVIVKCAGEAECLARVGQRVGAAEVILLGVSELGDVILTMQRIDVGAHAVSSRIADSLPTGSQPSDEQMQGYLTRLLPPGDFVRFGVLDIIVSEAGAAVTVNKEARGITPIQPLKLSAPATYQIRVEKQGFVPYAGQVSLPADGEITLRANLQRPGGHVAWYQHWYVIAAAGVLAAGVAGGAILYEERGAPLTSVPVSGSGL